MISPRVSIIHTMTGSTALVLKCYITHDKVFTVILGLCKMHCTAIAT